MASDKLNTTCMGIAAVIQVVHHLLLSLYLRLGSIRSLLSTDQRLLLEWRRRSSVGVSITGYGGQPGIGALIVLGLSRSWCKSPCVFLSYSTWCDSLKNLAYIKP